MPMFDVSEWLDMMGSTITVYAYTGQTVTGAQQWSSTGTDYDCYIEMKNHLVIDAKGREVMARGRIFVGSAAVIGIKDKVVLPSGYTPSSPPLLAVNLADDEAGVHHVTLEIG